MTTKQKAAGVVVSLTLLLGAQAQNSSTNAVSSASAAPPKSGTESAIDAIKHPVTWMNWGADFRARNEYFNNLLTLNPDASLHEQDYFRFRARLWTTVTPVEDLSVNARLATEPREWMKPAGYTPYRGNSGMDWTEGIIDNLNVQWRNIFDLPATLTVGRQELVLGEGWLVLEGTPNDGSWTTYLDAARFAYEMKEQQTTVQAIGILQYAQDDEWLPTINNQDRYLTDQDEKGAILYVSNKSLPVANMDAYFIYKHDTRLSDPALKYGDNADIYTLGLRQSGTVCTHWKYSAEAAFQFGNKQDPNVKFPSVSTEYRDIRAFGVNSKAGYLFKDAYSNELNVAFEWLSGDDPKSNQDEMFDVLWGRWPRWSEIGLYSYAPETRVGQEANLFRVGPNWSCTPLKNLGFSASYYALFAPQEVPTREASPTLFSNDGNFRGHFVQAVLKYKFNSHLSGHLWGECLFPGDYYAHHATMPFLRAEVNMVF